MGQFTNDLTRRSGSPSGAEDLERKLAELRTRLLGAKQFDQISQYFHDTIALDEAFLAASHPGQNEMLVSVLEQALRHVAPEGSLSGLTLLEVRQFGMWHGCARWGGGYVVFLYFEQPDMGLVCYCRSFSDPLTHYLRVSVCRPEGLAFSGASRRASA